MYNYTLNIKDPSMYIIIDKANIIIKVKLI
jgi:hypothetical protein